MVVIENVDSLKTWLVKQLSPVCDADPNALAKYVIALVQKDKTDDDLKTVCKEQLEVFLQNETDKFVNALFEVLQSKSYMGTQADSTTNSEVRTTTDEVKEKPKEVRSHRAKSRSKSPVRTRQRSPEGTRRRHYDDRRHRRRSPGADNRRHFGRRPRSRSSSPSRRRGRAPQEPLQRRLQKLASPRRSRSPPRRKRSRSVSRSRSASPARRSDRSSSQEKQKAEHAQDGSKKKQQCWDYEQKGFCMKGDQCPFDHGEDAVVVDDLSLTSSANQTDTKPSENKADAKPAAAAPVSIPPPQSVLPRLPMALPLPPHPMIPPPMPVPPPHLIHPFPPPINMKVPPPNFIRPPFPPSNVQPQQPYNPEAPGINSNEARKRDGNNLLSLTASSEQDNARKRPAMEKASGEPTVKRPYFNNASGHNNKTLIVKKIPPMLNNITKLNEHFAKFGAINNIQVKYDQQPSQALVEFAHPNSARAAIRDTEAVLNNRFIRVYWYTQSSDDQTQGTNGNSKPSVKDRLGSLPTPNQLKYTAPGVDQQGKAAFASGNLSRTISNPDAPDDEAKKATKPDPAEILASKEAAIKAKKKLIAARQAAKQKAIEQANMVRQKKVELQKQKQGLLQKQIEQQKLLLAKLESHKTMPPTERMELIKTLKALTSTIDSLRNVAKTKTAPQVAQEKQKQAQKDLLDTELDLYNASTNGENTSVLKKKLSQLKMEANTYGLVNAYRGGWGGGRGRRGRGRGRGNVHRFIRAGANIDRRPCEIRISGFHDDEKDEMITHFAEYGDIETFSFDEEGITCTVKYKTRHDAEQAASQGSMFKNRNLIIVWTSQPNKLPASVAPPAIPSQNQGLSPAQLLHAKEKDADESGDDEDDEISVVVEPVAAYAPPEEDETYGYGLLEEDELDEEALLTGPGIDDDEEEAVLDEERSWRH